jgi:hypothetical protein
VKNQANGAILSSQSTYPKRVKIKQMGQFFWGEKKKATRELQPTTINIMQNTRGGRREKKKGRCGRKLQHFGFHSVAPFSLLPSSSSSSSSCASLLFFV